MIRKNFLKNCDGALTVEFAIISLAFFALIPFIFDMAKTLNSSMSLSGALRAGTQFAITNPDNSSAITQIVKNASGFPSNDVSVTITQFCQCLTVDIACNSICSDGTVAKTYEKIAATYSVPTFFPYNGNANNYFVISQYAVVQIK